MLAVAKVSLSLGLEFLFLALRTRVRRTLFALDHLYFLLKAKIDFNIMVSVCVDVLFSVRFGVPVLASLRTKVRRTLCDLYHLYSSLQAKIIDINIRVKACLSFNLRVGLRLMCFLGE